MPKKAATKTTEKNTPADVEIIEAEWRDEADEADQEIPKRRDLLIEAIKAFRAALKTDASPNKTMVGNLMQLLKLHKELVREEEKPTHIELIWNEVDEGLYGDD
jgi:hypothetical protein